MRRTFACVAMTAVAATLLSGCVVATSSRGGSGGGGFLLFLPFILLMLLVRRMRGSRRRGASMMSVGPFIGSQEWSGADQQTENPRRSQSVVNEQMLRAELSVLADDVLRLEPQVVLREAARSDYEAARHRYRIAEAAIGQATGQDDLVRVQQVVDEAKDAMSRVRVLVDDVSTQRRREEPDNGPSETPRSW